MLLQMFSCSLKDPGCYVSVWNSVNISEPSSRMKASILQDIVIKQTRRNKWHKKKDRRTEG